MAEQCFRIGEACNNPIYLNWKNTLGGWDKWLFDCKQTYNLSVSTIGDFSPYFEDIESQNYTRELLKRDAVESLVLGADNLLIEDIQGLKELFYSPKVYVLKSWDMVTAPVWTQVIPSDGSIKLYETNRTYQSLEFEIEFPAKYTLQN